MPTVAIASIVAELISIKIAVTTGDKFPIRAQGRPTKLYDSETAKLIWIRRIPNRQYRSTPGNCVRAAASRIASLAGVILDYRPGYPFARSRASSLIETAHNQAYFTEHLPSLTDFSSPTDTNQLLIFLRHLLFSSLDSAV